MAYPDTLIYPFGSKGIRQAAYEDTKYYRRTRDFLARPVRMLKMPMKEHGS